MQKNQFHLGIGIFNAYLLLIDYANIWNLPFTDFYYSVLPAPIRKRTLLQNILHFSWEKWDVNENGFFRHLLSITHNSCACQEKTLVSLIEKDRRLLIAYSGTMIIFGLGPEYQSIFNVCRIAICQLTLKYKTQVICIKIVGIVFEFDSNFCTTVKIPIFAWNYTFGTKFCTKVPDFHDFFLDYFHAIRRTTKKSIYLVATRY